MLNHASQQVFQYWSQLRGERPAPSRTDIDPVALRRFLPHLLIIEAVEERELLFRLAGTHICDLFGRELRGERFSRFWLDEKDSRPLEVVHNVIHREQPAIIQVDLESPDDLHAYELLLLPVRSTGIHSDRAVGALLPQHTPLPEAAWPAAGLTMRSVTVLGANGAATQPVAPARDQGVFPRFWHSLVAQGSR